MAPEHNAVAVSAQAPFFLLMALKTLTLAFCFSLGSATMAMAAPFAYVANNLSRNVSVLDIATNAVTATVPVGVGPRGVAVNSQGTRVYVTNGDSNSVSVIDTATNTVIATVPVGLVPYGVAVNPPGTRVFVANLESASVSIIDTVTNTVAATVPVGTARGGPLGIAINPQGTRIFVTEDDTVSVIDTTSNAVVARVAVGPFPFGVAVNPQGTRVFVVHGAGNSVSVIDTATNAVIANVPVGSFPRGVAFNPQGTRAFVTNQSGFSVSVIDTATNGVIATVPVDSFPEGITVNPQGTSVFVVSTATDTVSVIDTATNTVTATVPVGNAPRSLGSFITPGRNITGSTATGTGTAMASISGGGARCNITLPSFILAPTPSPAGVTFPHGLFSFAATPCTQAGSVTVTLTYPSPIPPGAVYYKYGKEPGNSTPHYFTIPATISGNTVTFTLTDGLKGDTDATADGTITDPGGIGILSSAAGVAPIPTLTEWAMLALCVLMLALGARRIRRWA